MRFYTTLQLGQFHPTFCEDFLYCEQISKQWFLAAVFDGCSSGQDSHFAATLWGKIFKMIGKKLPYVQQINPNLNLDSCSAEQLGVFILKQFFEQGKQYQNDLFLETRELLATAVLALYNCHTKQTWLNISGDGVFAINNNIHSIDQADKPNYMAYHLNGSFEQWFSEECETFIFEAVQNLAISTDGILSFAKDTTQSVEGINPVEYLLIDYSFEQQDNMLDKKCIYLQKNFQLKPNDDLGIVRLINQG